MSRFARMTPVDEHGNSTAIEVIDAESDADIALRYHPTIASQFVAVPEDTVARSVFDGENWTAPEPVEPNPAPPVIHYRTLVSPIEFKMLFTTSERLAIGAAREYSGDDEAQKQLAAAVNDWWSIIDDPRLTAVNLALPQSQEGLDMLVPAGILTPERREEIGLGIPE